ncbi:aspartyl-phosphate phosphatase Spo0E family protein [Bacillus piscicola]|uniref:aspartyl-phosphate phosphatase Spo0E family protein n=1 Tax=Bacillus piscicola TaxID=1632684 RepID=UPI001F0995FD|nr:aspartyl-phosphate phosphatase Spo0E family protein [Bacillus piscicola]
MNELKKEVEECRRKMTELYEQVGDFTDVRVVQVSQELDALLNEFLLCNNHARRTPAPLYIEKEE